MFGVTSELTRHFLHQEPEAAVSVDEIAETAAEFCLGGLLGPDARGAGDQPVANSRHDLVSEAELVFEIVKKSWASGLR